jgi:hypothetical protein
MAAWKFLVHVHCHSWLRLDCANNKVMLQLWHLWGVLVRVAIVWDDDLQVRFLVPSFRW